MKKIILIFLFLISSISSVLACDVKIIPFGSEKEKIKMEIPPLSFPNQFGGEMVTIPIEEICKNEKDLFGTSVNFLFIENKLIQISLMRPNQNDARLMDYAMKTYGEFSLPGGIKKQQFRGNYIWEKGNENINYIYTNIHDGSAEIIEITSDLYLTQLQNYNEKIGEWLDSQK
jgi:hypothetical protein